MLQFNHLVVFNSLRPRGLQHARPPCPSKTPRVYSNSYPSSRWCHPIISSSVVPFSSCLQSYPASGSFQMSQFFASGGQSIGVSASAAVLPMNIQDWYPLGWTGWISLQSKGHSRVFSNTKWPWRNNSFLTNLHRRKSYTYTDRERQRERSQGKKKKKKTIPRLRKEKNIKNRCPVNQEI